MKLEARAALKAHALQTLACQPKASLHHEATGMWWLQHGVDAQKFGMSEEIRRQALSGGRCETEVVFGDPQEWSETGETVNDSAPF
jgi:hypothetical protein